MKILLTNDDGIQADGIKVLASELVKNGYDVTIIAPMEDSSGASAGVGQVYLRTESIRYEKVNIDGLENTEAYAIDALPALTVLAGFLGFLNFTPELVVSGINNGLNVGRSSLHSGTVGAALTSQHFSVPSIAVSVEWDEKPYFDTAATIACELISLFNFMPSKITLNLNVPSKPIEQLAGIKLTSLSNYGLIKKVIKNQKTSTLNLDLSQHDHKLDELSDIIAVRSNFASITPISSVKSLKDATLESHITDILGEVWHNSNKK